ncbi:hypothetical protein DFJ43DRAFT_1141813 [Lentinula guzmanii]|uniref:Uncharacterized protein n=1 Tax=Lentinula guzmanii TaxID=2804957 RepID=A0AA38MWM2_9AGAR|nr:hypothetical protein DFJ43DRAFT_1141813 [Lentinula guzmanii]
MVFSHSVLTTFIVVGTFSSVLALPFQGFSSPGLPQKDVASTATTQAMPTIPTGYGQGQSVQEDAVKNHNDASNSPSPSGLARRIVTNAPTSNNDALKNYNAVLGQIRESNGKPTHHGQTPSSPTLPLANVQHNTRSIYGEDLD